MIRPDKPLRRSRPSAELAQALAQQEQRRIPTIHERIQNIHARTEVLRKHAYLLTIPNRQF